MTLSRESILALQRHFLGALSAPARTWLEPLPASRLALRGAVLRSRGDGCMLDLGTVESPGEERHSVRVAHPGPERVEVRLAGTPRWLEARWSDGEDVVMLDGGSSGATLDLIVVHDTECEFQGMLTFAVHDGFDERLEEVPVRMTARRSYPLGRFDFNGSSAPRPFDFGTLDQPYELTIDSATSLPLVVRCADLPPWLTFEVDGHRRGGPLIGRFFERNAPVRIRLRPQYLGRHQGSLRIETNDPRPELQSFEIPLAACTEAATPCVRVIAPPRARVTAGATATVAARLENWGRSPARLSAHTVPRALKVDAPTVPAARGGNPGLMTMPIRVATSELAPGAHMLPIRLRVAGGEPHEIDIPVQIEVAPAVARTTSPPTTRPEMIAALVALLLLTLLLVFVVGGIS